MDKQRFYNWADAFSRQTGHQGEICIVVGAKGIGKTFGLQQLSSRLPRDNKQNSCKAGTERKGRP